MYDVCSPTFRHVYFPVIHVITEGGRGLYLGRGGGVNIILKLIQRNMLIIPI